MENQPVDRKSNPVLPDYEAGMLATRSQSNLLKGHPTKRGNSLLKSEKLFHFASCFSLNATCQALKTLITFYAPFSTN
jgi:hypothetical protein